MSLHAWTLLLSSFEAFLAIVTLVLLVRAKSTAQYWPLLALVLTGIIPYFLLLWLRAYRLLSPMLAYDVYFFTFWSLYAAAAVCSGIMTYVVFQEALRPLKGLQTLGTIMYRWTSSVSVAVAVGAALLPSSNINQGIALAVSQLLRASGIIVLSLILFVGFSIKPLGLTLRSRVFGVGAGIGVIAFSNILQAGYFSRRMGLYSSLGIIETVFHCVAEVIWIVYFWLPEPQRKFVLLPTTSPFHSWNQISEILGHDPGYVAIGGIPPEAFAPAEIDVFNRASRSMTDGGENVASTKAFATPRRPAMPTPEEEIQKKREAQAASERLMKAFSQEG